MMFFFRIKQYLNNLITIGRAITGTYNFTLNDYFIYLRFAESPGPQKKCPDIQKIDEDDSFIQLKIGKYTYYWPRILNLHGISYMHQEIFEPAKNNSHAYEFGELYIKKGDIVIDAGACEGFFTRYALERGARIISIEPVKQLAEALKRTFSGDIQKGNVTIVNAAIGSYTTQGSLSIDHERIYKSRLHYDGDPINIITLDDFVTTKVDFIKMDIEGGEIDAIHGAVNTIKRYKPKLSIAVYHKYENAQKILDYLHEICPEYIVKYRGIYAYDNEKPRPMMVYAWESKIF